MTAKESFFKGLKPSEREGRHDPKFIGEISGYPVGSTFRDRNELSSTGVHAPLRAGIHGNKQDGAYSVVLSYGYEDDEDEGETFIYTGQGGRASDSSKLDQMQGKEAWKDEGATGFMTCKFRFERLPHQLPLPRRRNFSSITASSSKKPLTSRITPPSFTIPVAGPSTIREPRKAHVPRPPYRPSEAEIAKLRRKSTSSHPSERDSHTLSPQLLHKPLPTPPCSLLPKQGAQKKHVSLRLLTASPELTDFNRKRPRSSDAGSASESSGARRSTGLSMSPSVSPAMFRSSGRPWDMVKGKQELPSSLGFKKRRVD
ncbi:hypothetical protein DXG01_012776 [Tephrocybe rancida]|nr:hypothetical protein DXG01_012776 [Tephrocybe rancida]